MTSRLILVLTALACAQASANESPATAQGFLPSGKVILGANYWASHAATEMWRKWDAAAVDADLRTLAENGFRLLRVFPNWADFQPIHACYLNADNFDVVNETRMFDSEEPLPDTLCGRAGVDELMVERFEAFCDIAEKHGISLIVPLLTGQMTFRNLIPPALSNRNPFSDPYALMWEGRYLECLVSRLKGKKAIVAWESGNEARYLGKTANSFQSEAWLRYIHQTIRLADASRPVVGVDGLDISREQLWPIRMNADLSDCTAMHPYGFGGTVYNDDFLSVRSTTFATALTYSLEQFGGKPAFIEEHGCRRQEQTCQDGVAKYMRTMLWNAWAADCRAMLWWCAYDQKGMTIAPYNWRQPCVELGIFKRDRTPYPAVDSVKRFVAFQDGLPFAALPKARTDAVVLTVDSAIVLSGYVLARQAGFMPRFANPEEKLPESDCYFLPDANGRAHLTIERWEELKARVRQGATLYLSWDDTFLDSMEEVGGVEVAFRERRSGTDVCDFGDFTQSIGYSIKRRFRPLTAETLAKNQQGEGVFFRNRYGKGTVYVLIHNFEKTTCSQAGAFEGEGWKIWAKVRPVRRLLKTGMQNLFVSEHHFGDGRCGLVLVNNSRNPYSGRPALAAGWKVESALADDPVLARWFDGQLELGGHTGMLLIVGRQ